MNLTTRASPNTCDQSTFYKLGLFLLLISYSHHLPDPSFSFVMEVVLPDGVPNQSRIKRKPPPRLDVTARYPPPDPNDPFAPLSVLRSRSSALLGFSSSQDNLSPISPPGYRASFQLYPAAPLNLDDLITFQSRCDFELHGELATPPRSPVAEAHYRRRSQSVMGQYNAHQYSVTLPKSAHKESLSREAGSDSSGTDVEGVDSTRPTSPTQNQRIGAHGRISHFFTPRKKPSQMSINSSVSIASSNSKTPTKLSLTRRPSLLRLRSPLQSTPRIPLLPAPIRVPSTPAKNTLDGRVGTVRRNHFSPGVIPKAIMGITLNLRSLIAGNFHLLAVL
ncbi:hypothetical protein E1B28_010953 [Marasmius oreades]|uniref:Uncharacterized protein n=1 Tax=Marasmius oreades TaxID=181124 RepID=A0A9P7URJ9_9AGAR|nr:uncharacterized protein E1B28_010953 [Marasmius oreades]KAG7089254.1 hypothetical protein E1B28_010953 [Marasmius oreades]